jgi:UDP-3-O-[3-hydroxymyristoyl] glucosamine N-acyltransferase
MEFSAYQISQLLEGEIVGDEEALVNGLSKIDDGQANTLSFLANPAYTEYIYSTKATVVIVGKDFLPERSLPETCTLIKVENPYGSFAKLLEMYNQIRFDRTGISERANISESATIGEKVYIGPGVVVEEGAKIGDRSKIYGNCFIGQNAVIGKDCILHAGVSVMAECLIGDDCVLQPGVVVGGDGFGFSPNSENNYHKVPQIGNVIIEDHVEIGANTTIDRATLGSTIIRRGVKIDNLIQVAHNVEIGENTVIAAQTGIAGSTKIGKNCMIGGQVGIIGHLNIADGVKIAAQSGIARDINEENAVVQGSPAFSYVDYKKAYVGFKNLPHLMKEIKELKSELASLKRLPEE